jgi:glycosyltransferase involved in cell wall biosynthesis
MYKTFFYLKEFLKKFTQTISSRLFNSRLRLREILTFVSMRQKRVYMTVSSDLATDNRVHRSCTVLEELGFQIHLFGRQKKNSPVMPPRSYCVRRMQLKFEKGAFFYAELNIRLFLILLFKKYDFLFANDLDTLPAAYLASRLKRKPLLYDSHELFTEVPELVGRPRVQKVWQRLEKKMLPHIDHMITVNQSIAGIFENKYAIHCSVVRNVPMRLDPIAAHSKSFLGLSDAQIMLIIQGSGLNIERGIEEAVMAMAQIPRAVLFLVGDGDAIPSIQKLVAQLQLQDQVRFIGRVPYNELLRYTAAADLGLALDKPLSLNYALALPNKVFDYIQAGTPIVASSLIEIETLIHKHNCGVVLPEVTPQMIAEKINALIDQPERRAEYKKNCQQAALLENWDTDKQVLMDVVQRVFV